MKFLKNTSIYTHLCKYIYIDTHTRKYVYEHTHNKQYKEGKNYS